MSTGDFARARVADRPPNPAPMMTTWGLCFGRIAGDVVIEPTLWFYNQIIRFLFSKSTIPRTVTRILSLFLLLFRGYLNV